MTVENIIQLLALIYVLIGISMIFNSSFYKKLFEDMVQSKSFLFISWLLAFVLGFVLLLYYPDINFSKEWLIALIWYLSLIKGMFLLVFPRCFTKLVKFVLKYYNVYWPLVLLLWLILIYIGFFVK